MKSWTAAVLVSVAFAGAGCGANHGSIVIDAGLTTAIEVCSSDSSTYVGFLELSRTEFESHFAGPQVGFLMGGSAWFFLNGPPYPSMALNGSPAVFCTSTPAVGECCGGPLPFDADAGSTAARVGPEYVTCLGEKVGDANGSGSVTDPYGGAKWSNWSGSDSLQCSADGGVAGSFTTAVSTPPDVVGLSHDLFPLDAGPVTISRTQDLVLTWTAGSSSSTVAINLLGSTSGVSCLAADTGSFTVPSVLLNQFPPGEQGALAIYRYDATCVEAPSVQLSVLIENGVRQAVVYP